MPKAQGRRHFIDTGVIASRLRCLLLASSGGSIATLNGTLPFIGFRASTARVGTTMMSIDSLKCVLKLALVAAGVIVATSTLVGLVSAPVQLPDLFRRSDAPVNEQALEHQINTLYCTVKGHQICEFGTIADVKQLFSLDEWPVHSNHQAGKRVSACCEGYVASFDHRGYQARMEVCRVCGRIRTRIQSRQQDAAGSGTDDLILRAVARLTLDELDWCGGFLTNQSWTADTSRSPYQRHREIFQGLDARLKPVPTEDDTLLYGSSKVLIVVFALVQLGVAKRMIRPLLPPFGAPK